MFLVKNDEWRMVYNRKNQYFDDPKELFRITFDVLWKV